MRAITESDIYVDNNKDNSISSKIAAIVSGDALSFKTSKSIVGLQKHGW